jgi:hypothetical protein
MPMLEVHSPHHGGWPTSKIWVPHLRDSFIVAKVGYLGCADRLSRRSNEFVLYGLRFAWEDAITLKSGI